MLAGPNLTLNRMEMSCGRTKMDNLNLQHVTFKHFPRLHSSLSIIKKIINIMSELNNIIKVNTNFNTHDQFKVIPGEAGFRTDCFKI